MQHFKMLIRILMLACGCLLFSSCAGYNLSTEDLMQPPSLTAEQKAIEDALLDSVVAGDISFKYPQTGNYRSAFIFQDIDADGQDEALVFYVTGSSEYARLSVLDRDASGQWKAGYEISGPHQNVEFISFARISSSSALDVVVGWSDPDSGDKRLGVYTYTDLRLNSLIDGSPIYDAYLIHDIDRSGRDDLFVMTRNSGTREEASWIHLFGFDGYKLELVDELPLSTPLVGFAGVTAGKLGPNDARLGVFIDEMQVGDSLVTEVFTLLNGDLLPVINHSMVSASSLFPVQEEQKAVEAALDNENSEDSEDSDEAPVALPTLFELTLRSDATALCADINNDGVIEIPTAQALPGYEDAELSDALFLTDYNQLYAQSFRRVFSVVTNRSAGYQIKFPSAWIGRVTVVSQPENNEWRFIEYNVDSSNPLNDLSGELLRIRVVSRKDYQDKFLENYTVLATRGAFTYYGYIPPTASISMGIPLQQLQDELFSLI